jgi:hypothetical protein
LISVTGFISFMLMTWVAPSGAAEVINVGYTGPLSGGAAKYGQNNLDGLKMAVDEINESGGMTATGRPMRSPTPAGSWNCTNRRSSSAPTAGASWGC